MKVKTKLLILLVGLVLITVLAGCNKSKNEDPISLKAMRVASEKEALIEANPTLAVDAVYEAVEDSQGGYDAWELSEEEFRKITGISEEEALEVVAFYSNPKSVLADVFIIKPYPSLRENVRGKLMNYRETRMREFENFDILDAYAIAKGAVVYDQGEYLVMLMVKDNETAQEQIDLYIPQ